MLKSILNYFVTLLAGLFIFIGLPLLAWGIGDLHQFFASNIRLTYVLEVLSLQLFALFYNPQVGRNQEDRKPGQKTRSSDLLLIQLLSLSIVLAAPFSDRHSVLTINLIDALRSLGFILLLPGFVLMQMAEKYLGRQFSVQVTLQKDHHLIQGGPYKFIRHPRYLGILAFFAGISIIFRSFLALLMVFALGVVLVRRISAEEELMRLEFGQEWDLYSQKTWRILPFVF